MAKEKISVTVDATVLADADTDAKAAGLNRSELIEQALRNEHLRRALHTYTTRTAPALDIDSYAEQVYEATGPPACDHARRHRTAPGHQPRTLRRRALQFDPPRRQHRASHHLPIHPRPNPRRRDGHGRAHR